MKKLIYPFLIIIPFLSFSNTVIDNELWKSYPIKDANGNEIQYKNQDFLSFNKDIILWFKFKELMSMETGEISIKTQIDTFILGPIKGELYDIYSKYDTLNLKLISDSKLVIYHSGYELTFKKLIQLDKPKLTLNEVRNHIIGSTFYEIGPNSKVIGNISTTYQNNGKALYKRVDSRTDWESDFQVVEFQKYIFLKGITSAPIIINSINDTAIIGLKVDYRFNPENCILSKIKPISKLSSTNNSFELPVPNISFKECVSNLSSEILNKKLSTAKGIINKEFPVVQVQHSYSCRWNLFHSEKFDGYEEATVSSLIKQDSSLCYVINIPCGYYAERDAANTKWYIYLHEERLETDSSFILKKAFRWDNTYRIINELKGSDVTYYEDYYLDSRHLKKTFTYNDGKEVGFTRMFNKDGVLIEEIFNPQ